MQAAQIDPKKIYAIHVRDKGFEENSYVARFKVDYVRSLMSRRQLKPTLADYSHQVYGTIDERDVPPQRLPAEPTTRAQYLTRILEPHQIEDEYERFIELKQRAQGERQRAEDERNRRTGLARDLVTAFYELTGLEPAKRQIGQYLDSESPFASNDYNGGVSISFKGVEALLSALAHKPVGEETK
jgi:hypothetical protein